MQCTMDMDIWTRDRREIYGKKKKKKKKKKKVSCKKSMAMALG